MYGILTSNPTLVREPIGSVAYYIADGVSGRRRASIEGTITSVACWGDTAAVRDDPSRAARSEGGTRALPTVDGHHWGTVCPTAPDYRTDLLDRIVAVGNIGAVRLTTPGFPGSAFCRCDRCERQFEMSKFDDRQAWRTETITQFVREASTRVDEDLIVTLYPDPCPGNLGSS